MEEPHIIRPAKSTVEPASTERQEPRVFIPVWVRVLTMLGTVVFFMGSMFSTWIMGIDYDYSDWDTQRTMLTMASLVSQAGLLMVSLSMIHMGFFMPNMDHKTRRLCLGILIVLLIVSSLTMI